jgi:hypothetical protein
MGVAWGFLVGVVEASMLAMRSIKPGQRTRGSMMWRFGLVWCSNLAIWTAMQASRQGDVFDETRRL